MIYTIRLIRPGRPLHVHVEGSRRAAIELLGVITTKREIRELLFRINGSTLPTVPCRWNNATRADAPAGLGQYRIDGGAAGEEGARVGA